MMWTADNAHAEDWFTIRAMGYFQLLLAMVAPFAEDHWSVRL